MKYKLIAFDLDGTLLDGRKQVSPENLRALEAAAESGAVVAAATGRIIGGIPEEIRSLPFLRYYISVNGAYVYDTLEDRVRDLSHEPKIPGETAIPSGCYEVSSYALYVVESLEVIVATVEDIERTFFVGNHIHRIHVVHSGFSYVKECRNRSLNVTERIL